MSWGNLGTLKPLWKSFLLCMPPSPNRILVRRIVIDLKIRMLFFISVNLVTTGWYLWNGYLCVYIDWSHRTEVSGWETQNGPSSLALQQLPKFPTKHYYLIYSQNIFLDIFKIEVSFVWHFWFSSPVILNQLDCVKFQIRFDWRQRLPLPPKNELSFLSDLRTWYRVKLDALLHSRGHSLINGCQTIRVAWFSTETLAAFVRVSILCRKVSCT